MKILILNDGSEYENWGIQACIDGIKYILGNNTIDSVKHSNLHQKYSFEPELFGKKIFNNESRITKRFFQEYLKTPNVVDELDYFCDLWERGEGGPGSRDIIDAISASDIVAFNAEGSTYRKNIGAFRSLFLLYLAKKKFGKKAFFVNGSVTLNEVDATLPAYIDKIFHSIDGVCVREPKSAKSLQNFTSFRNFSVIPDSVFALDLQNSEVDLNQQFCFSLSMLPMQRYPVNNTNPMVNLVNRASVKFGKCKFLAKDVEDQYLKELANHTKSAFLGHNLNYTEIERELAKSKCLISGRYHHLIFALRVGCPVIPLKSSSHKIDGLMEFYEGLLPSPFDPTSLRTETTKILDYLDNFNDIALRKKIRKRSEELRLRALNLRTELVKC
ncbi:polysaccharide pyruvyl transferase family protein [Octadecabacter sp.]|nr:polysaccharide pyruvyl transferase family protein [Octadecabacter sp.]